MNDVTKSFTGKKDLLKIQARSIDYNITKHKTNSSVFRFHTTTSLRKTIYHLSNLGVLSKTKTHNDLKEDSKIYISFIATHLCETRLHLHLSQNKCITMH